MNYKKYKYIFLCALLSLSVLFAPQSLATVAKKKSSYSRKKKSASRWKYIVVHHSATKQGNAVFFDRYHRKRGMKNGLAYHFVIDNGTSSRQNGELEIGSRWKKQISGGHCKQRWVNNSGIGICLVGDFSKQKPSKKQMKTLIQLCKLLMDRYNIPATNVRGHGEMKGEHSKCPGKNMLMKTLRRTLTKYQNTKKHFIP